MRYIVYCISVPLSPHYTPPYSTDTGIKALTSYTPVPRCYRNMLALSSGYKWKWGVYAPRRRQCPSLCHITTQNHNPGVHSMTHNTCKISRNWGKTQILQNTDESDKFGVDARRGCLKYFLGYVTSWEDNLAEGKSRVQRDLPYGDFLSHDLLII